MPRKSRKRRKIEKLVSTIPKHPWESLNPQGKVLGSTGSGANQIEQIADFQIFTFLGHRPDRDLKGTVSGEINGNTLKGAKKT